MTTARRRAALTAGSAVVALALVAGCGSSRDTAAPAPSGTPTVSPRRTCGARSRAPSPVRTRRSARSSPTPPGDPHSYESTPADAAAISRADLVVANGGGYDTFVDKVTDADAGRRRPTPSRRSTCARTETDDNEHVWFDPTTVKAVADQVADRLSAAEPAKAAALHQRATAFDVQVDRIAAQTAAIGRARPARR